MFVGKYVKVELNRIASRNPDGFSHALGCILFGSQVDSPGGSALRVQCSSVLQKESHRDVVRAQLRFQAEDAGTSNSRSLAA